MTDKQVTTTAVAVQQAAPQNRNLFISVKTFDGPTGKTVGERIVDMYHFGTRNWLQNHHWWAMHHGHQVETTVATAEEADSYVQTAKLALAQRFNSEPPKQLLLAAAPVEPIAVAA